MTAYRRLVTAVAIVVLGATPGPAAERTILGASFGIKLRPTPGPSQLRVSVLGKETSSPDVLAGDPTVAGATLEIVANGGAPTADTFLLPQGDDGDGGQLWTAGSGRYTYRDRGRLHGPVRLAKISRTSKGTFRMKIVLLGDGGTTPLRPPDPGTDACVALTLGGGDRYSVRFGPDSTIANQGATGFTAKRPASEGVCVTTTTTPSSTTSTSSTSTTTVPQSGCTMPSSCGNFMPCGAESCSPGDACAATAEGGRVCVLPVPVPDPCPFVMACGSSADCGPSAHCVLDTCCPQVNVCIPDLYLCSNSSSMSGAFVAPLTAGPVGSFF